MKHLALPHTPRPSAARRCGRPKCSPWLLCALLLWLLLPLRAAAQTPKATAVYDKATGVLTLDQWTGSDRPEPQDGRELYMLFDPADAQEWFVNPDGQGTDYFNWTETTRQATRVVIGDNFRLYSTLPTCKKMFSGFKHLKAVDGLDCFNTFNQTATDMSEMFSGCEQIESLVFPGFFQTENIKDMSYMFANCYALEKLDLSAWNTYQVEDMSYMFVNCEHLASLDMSGLDMTRVTDMTRMFSNCPKLPRVELHFNAGELEKMPYMFYGCTSLQEVDLTPLMCIHNVTKMNGLFEGCTGLRSVNMSGLDASMVENMSQMFAGCEELAAVRLDGVKARNVTDMSGMFYLCRKLGTLDLSGFSTGKVEDMSGMFFCCNALTAITFSKNFTTARVKNMAHMFNGCSALTELDVSGFTTARVTSMDQMFNGCSALTALDVSGFNTANVTNMNSMFCFSHRLTALDLSGFNTSKVTDMSSMFGYCEQLRDIYVGDGFTTAALTSAGDFAMFSGCGNLPGWDAARTGKECAHYGDGGYLLKVVGRSGDRKIGARGSRLTASRVTLADGEDLEILTPFTAQEMIYTRTMDDLQWQAAYLPFALTADALPEGYAAASVSDFHEYEQSDGTWLVELEARQIAAGKGIDALTPFLLRRTQDGADALTLRAEGVELTADMVRESTCASVDRLYTFLGTMQAFATPGPQDLYLMQDGDLTLVRQVTRLLPGRWYMSPSVREGSTLAQALPGSITVRVSGDTTAVGPVTGAPGHVGDAIYDLSGRRLGSEPAHGVYIKNGRKHVK